MEKQPKSLLKLFALLLFFLFGIGSALGLSGCGAAPAASKPAASAAKKVIRAGMDAAYPPFGFQDMDKKEYMGFDVDIIKAIGKEEGFDVEVRNVNFDGLIPALQSGDLDVAINDITITEDRKKSVDFSKRYYIAGLGVVVKSDNNSIQKKEDLSGKTLGVTIGSTGEEAARKIEGANVRVYSTLSDAFLDLKQGAVDCVVNDIPTNEYYVAKTSDKSVKTAPVALTTEDLGIAVKKGNKELLTKIDDGLAKMKKNGEFAKIYKKWFGKEPPAEVLK
ncbi:basic amino acid ABC transporter substrate-binding protein [uncultured Dialister sp.]|uniref:basic amino acid ABC transporter substrate-binding protein n=1 Tax=uncultured Dialister sp. TaxID=278064 RepID=UPI0025CF26DE|nr:basic amino acid ABC transporter substrate-binding protein [uncultured Dialister sp.]